MDVWQFIKDVFGGLIRFFSLKTRIKELKKENLTLKEEKQKIISTSEQKISNLEAEILKLKAQTSEKSLKYDNHFRYYTDEANHIYCPSCYDTKKLRIHLKPLGNPIQSWQCPNPECKDIILNPDYIDPPPEPYDPLK